MDPPVLKSHNPPSPVNQDLIDQIFSRLMMEYEGQPKYWCPHCKNEVWLNVPYEPNLKSLCLGCWKTGTILTEKPLVNQPS